MISHAALLGALVGTAYAGTILWDGRFNEFSTSTDLTKWSWSNQVGPYQYYIHGSGAVTEYVNLSPTYKNPADTASKQGVKITIDSTAKWNSDMWRTELIPQTTAAINKGHVYYHFSIKRSSTNVPSATNEHQICFFESHFTELKYGWVNGESGTTDTNLQWMVSSTGKWKTTFDADVWHNVAYEIDFSGGTVTFWHSTGSDPLTKTAGPFSASASSNGEDWHLGVLRLPRSGNDGTGAEDWYFSGVYIETGSLTTSVTGPGGSSSGSSSGSSAAGATDATVAGTTAVATTATTMAASGGTTTGTVAQYGQCGGTGYSGDTGCVSGYTCTKVNDYYSQCL
ncbi:carbohydrate-binding module family 1 protein [Glonium stellatum]|uniref:Carbohydrate-binding module family 1 protein n=1 Tax=Glonium stellatum TaxID=574774 RepID=A0A8E2F0U0_9PEZI|nr:carbohydrate-binding module family 1 protein [Glonium stellatum]